MVSSDGMGNGNGAGEAGKPAAFSPAAGLRPRSAALSLGVVETLGLTPVVEALDAMIKAANVEIVRFEKLGLGWVFACVVGDVGSVTAAVEAGRGAAERLAKSGVTTGGLTKAAGAALEIIPVSSCVLASPSPAVVTFLRGSADEQPAPSGGAIGFVETMGFVAAVQALDAMVKGASVSFSGYSGTPPKFVVWIQGDVAAVRQAISLGGEAANRVGKSLSTCLLARPHLETAENLPVKSTASPISLGSGMPRHLKLLPAG